ncbi:MAG: spore germination protein [Paenibacillaceae bacterium]|jgi:spore germination protein D|nr:spore germination protein [Paenibacillaceae bacterium]
MGDEGDMKANWKYATFAVLAMTLTASCSSESNSGSGSATPNYKETKSMVLDILKTEDGKKAILDASTQGMLGMQGLSIGDQGNKLKAMSAEQTHQLQLAVKDVLTDSNSNTLLQRLMTDPKFSAQFAKAISKENKQLQKDLLKDPEYQKTMIDIMKNPEYEKMLLDVMKGSQYRQQTMAVMQESMQSPMFRLELLTLLKKVMEEESQPKLQGQGQGKKQSNDQQSDKSKSESKKSGE